MILISQKILGGRNVSYEITKRQKQKTKILMGVIKVISIYYPPTKRFILQFKFKIIYKWYQFGCVYVGLFYNIEIKIKNNF